MNFAFDDLCLHHLLLSFFSFSFFLLSFVSLPVPRKGVIFELLRQNDLPQVPVPLIPPPQPLLVHPRDGVDRIENLVEPRHFSDVSPVLVLVRLDLVVVVVRNVLVLPILLVAVKRDPEAKQVREGDAIKAVRRGTVVVQVHHVVLEERVDHVQVLQNVLQRRPVGDLEELLEVLGARDVLQDSLVRVLLVKHEVLRVVNSKSGPRTHVLFKPHSWSPIEPNDRLVRINLLAHGLQKRSSAVPDDGTRVELAPSRQHGVPDRVGQGQHLENFVVDLANDLPLDVLADVVASHVHWPVLRNLEVRSVSVIAAMSNVAILEGFPQAVLQSIRDALLLERVLLLETWVRIPVLVQILLHPKAFRVQKNGLGSLPSARAR